jgi:hypothetical protein
MRRVSVPVSRQVPNACLAFEHHFRIRVPYLLGLVDVRLESRMP